MKKILFISPFLPYDKVPHAGGKCHNFYIKRLKQNNNYDIKLITFSKKSEMKHNDLDKYDIDNKIFIEADFSKKKNFINNLIAMNPLDKNAGMCRKYLRENTINELKKLKKQKYTPDVIILEWTQTILLVSEIKDIFTNCKIIGIEHDVTYQSFFRKSNYGKSLLKKKLFKQRYKNMFKTEIDKINECDLILTLNIKDYDILQRENVKSRLDYISPYYMNLDGVKPSFHNKNLIFFGAMNRKENYESCIWFIENVFNELIKIDREFKFFIIGNKPNQSLNKYKSDNIIITGFVDDVSEYFNNALCMVAPLVLGAGIKIKVLEAMSAGLIVLTNEIGIEGIPVQRGKHYIHCENKDEYLQEILNIDKGMYDLVKMSIETKKYLKTNFNIENSSEKYIKYLESL